MQVDGNKFVVQDLSANIANFDQLVRQARNREGKYGTK